MFLLTPPSSPGFGGSTPVAITQRVATYLKILPPLLTHLHVAHVIPISHSAGAIYLLSFLHQHAQLLHPTHPYTALIAPWVHSSHSSVALLGAAAKLPESVIGVLGSVLRFVGTRAMPASSWSGGLVQDVAGWFSGGSQSDGEDADADEGSVRAAYAVDKKTKAEVDRLRLTYFFAEQPTGIRDESLVCLKKGDAGLWGVADDYAVLARTLSQRFAEQQQQGQSARPLKMQAYFSESDIMIGKGGQRYFEDCWRAEAREAAGVRFESFSIPGTNHESIVSADKKAWGMIVGEVRAA